MARLGCAPATLRALNPRLVVCSISAFGQDGPYREWPAFDLALQAMGGAMSLTGEAGRAPARMGLPMGDLAGGMFGALAVGERAVPARADRRGRALRPLAPRLPGLAPDLRRPVLLGGRAGAGPRRLRARVGRALPGLRHAGRPRRGRRLRREVLGRILPGDRARPISRPTRGSTRTRSASSAGRSWSRCWRRSSRADDRRMARPAPAGGRARRADQLGGPGRQRPAGAAPRDGGGPRPPDARDAPDPRDAGEGGRGTAVPPRPPRALGEDTEPVLRELLGVSRSERIDALRQRDGVIA